MKQGTLKPSKAKRTKLVPHMEEPRERATGVQAHNTGKGARTQTGQPTYPQMNPFMYRHKEQSPEEGTAKMLVRKSRAPKRKFKNA
jgi:hypothetical protein